MLLQLAHHALAAQQITHKKQGQHAKAEKSHAQRPFVPDRVDKHQRIHKGSKSSREDKNEDGSQNGQVQLAPLELVQFLAIQSCHGTPHWLCPSPEPVAQRAPSGTLENPW